MIHILLFNEANLSNYLSKQFRNVLNELILSPAYYTEVLFAMLFFTSKIHSHSSAGERLSMRIFVDFLKHEDPMVVLTNLDNAGIIYVYGHIHSYCGVIFKTSQC